MEEAIDLEKSFVYFFKDTSSLCVFKTSQKLSSPFCSDTQLARVTVGRSSRMCYTAYLAILNGEGIKQEGFRCHSHKCTGVCMCVPGVIVMSIEICVFRRFTIATVFCSGCFSK